MECHVAENGSLFDNSEIKTEIFEIPFDFFDELIAPDFCVFQVNVSNQNLIQFNFSFEKLIFKLKFLVSMSNEFCSILLVAFFKHLLNLTILRTTDAFRVRSPFKLLQNIWIKSI